MTEQFIGLWRATYLLPYAENTSARPDKRHPHLYRHTTLHTADDRISVQHLLRERGAVSILVKPAPLPHPLFRRVSARYKRAFLQSLQFAIEGGLSPGRALEGMILGETGSMRTRFNFGLNLLQNGRPFVEVMRALDLFDGPTLAMISAGEETGRLKDAIASAIGHMSKSALTLKIMFGAIAMTALDLIFAASSIVGIRFGLLPKIRSEGLGAGATKEQVANFEHILSLATVGNDILLAFSVFLTIAIAWACFAYFGRNESLRDQIDAVLVKLPVVGSLYVHSAVSSTAAIMSNLLRGGVTFIPACSITLRGTRLPVVRKYWQEASYRAESGEAVSHALANSPMEHLEQMILANHTNSQQLASALEEISKGRDQEAQRAAKRFGVLAFTASMLYSGLAVLLALAVVYVQSTAAMTSPGG